MRILIVTQWFDPEPTFKGLAFAKALAERGHEVEVLTGFPNYPEGKVYPGYRVRPWTRQVMDGIRVVRVALYPSHDRSAFRRVMNYVSFALSASLMGPFLVRRANVAYVYHPPPTVGLAAIVLKWFRGIPFVYDIQDLWPDSLAATGMLKNRVLLRLVAAWCKFVNSQAATIVVLSPGFKRKLEEQGVPPTRIHIVYNWCDEEHIRPVPRDEALARALGMEGRFNVVFAGNMGLAQGMDTVLDAAELLRLRHPEVQFVLVGGGTEVERLKERASSKSLDNVLFMARRPFAEIAPILGHADVLLVHLKEDPLFEITIPSKIQAYLAMGRPVLAAISGDGAELVRQARAGEVCSPQDPLALANALTRIAEMPVTEREQYGIAAQKYYRESLSMNLGVHRLELLMHRVGGVCSS